MSALWTGISFREPLWLWLALQPLLILLLLRLLRSRRGDGYSDPRLRPWVISQVQTGQGRRYVRVLALWLAWCLFAVAIAGPRLPQAVAGNQQTAQRELMVLLDLSPSMAARDVPPNRLERAKLELLDLINRMQSTRMGIVVFGAQPHLLSPLTTDKAVLRHYVATLHPNQLPSAGSRLGRALDYARTQFDAQHKTPRALLLLSDGEFHADTNQQSLLEDSVQQLAQQGIRFYALGIGTAYGAPVLAAGQGWLEYEGRTVTNRLHSSELQRLTQIGHGRYSDIHDSNRDWQTLYDEGIARLTPVTHAQATEFIIWQELYHWFVLPAVALFLLALWQPRQGATTTVLALLVLLSANILMPGESLAADDYQTAYQALSKKDYQQARRQFARLAGYAARLGEGVAAYRLHDYQHAAQQFTQAMLDASNDVERGQALFNLANCQYQLQEYHAAARTYADVLAYLPEHKGARVNRDYALALQSEQTTDNAIHRRAGSGAKTGRVQEGTDVGEGRLTLGDDADNAPATADQPSAPTPSATTPLLQQARTASGKVDQDEDKAWDYRIHSLDQLQQENPRIESDAGQFWQRLYEWEEGYMAPQDQPHQLPGVKPW